MHDFDLQSLCRKAKTELESAVEMKPTELVKQVDLAEISVVRLRDALIERLRRADPPEEAMDWHRVLDRVNVVLSMICGVEFPGLKGIERSTIGEASKLLEQAAQDLDRV